MKMLTPLFIVVFACGGPNGDSPDAGANGLPDSSVDVRVVDAQSADVSDASVAGGRLVGGVVEVDVGLERCMIIIFEAEDGDRRSLTADDEVILEIPDGLVERLDSTERCDFLFRGVQAGTGPTTVRWRGLEKTGRIDVEDASLTLRAVFQSHVTGAIAGSRTNVSARVPNARGVASGTIAYEVQPGNIRFERDARDEDIYFIPPAAGTYSLRATWNDLSAEAEETLCVWDVGDTPPSRLSQIVAEPNEPNAFLIQLPLTNTCTELRLRGEWYIEEIARNVPGDVRDGIFSVEEASGQASIDGTQLCGQRAGAAMVRASAGSQTEEIPLVMGGDQVMAIEVAANLTYVEGQNERCGDLHADITLVDGRTFGVGAEYLSLFASSGPFDSGTVSNNGSFVCVGFLEPPFDITARFAGSEVSGIVSITE